MTAERRTTYDRLLRFLPRNSSEVLWADDFRIFTKLYASLRGQDAIRVRFTRFITLTRVPQICGSFHVAFVYGAIWSKAHWSAYCWEWLTYKSARIQCVNLQDTLNAEVVDSLNTSTFVSLVVTRGLNYADVLVACFVTTFDLGSLEIDVRSLLCWIRGEILGAGAFTAILLLLERHYLT